MISLNSSLPDNKKKKKEKDAAYQTTKNSLHDHVNESKQENVNGLGTCKHVACCGHEGNAFR